VTAILSSPPSVPTIPPVNAPGLSPQQITELIQARERGTKIRRAGTAAVFDGWMIAVFAVITALTGLTHVPSLLLGLGMMWVAWQEFRGARLLRRLQPSASRSLAKNQIVLAAILISYAIWQGYHGMTGAGSLTASAGGDPQLTRLLGPIDQLINLITLSVYGLLVLIAIFVQGGTALYYFTREKYVNAYLRQTPDWILNLQRSGLSI
jgi:hypothetical protein